MIRDNVIAQEQQKKSSFNTVEEASGFMAKEAVPLMREHAAEIASGQQLNNSNSPVLRIARAFTSLGSSLEFTKELEDAAINEIDKLLTNLQKGSYFCAGELADIMNGLPLNHESLATDLRKRARAPLSKAFRNCVKECTTAGENNSKSNLSFSGISYIASAFEALGFGAKDAAKMFSGKDIASYVELAMRSDRIEDLKKVMEAGVIAREVAAGAARRELTSRLGKKTILSNRELNGAVQLAELLPPGARWPFIPAIIGTAKERFNGSSRTDVPYAQLAHAISVFGAKKEALPLIILKLESYFEKEDWNSAAEFLVFFEVEKKDAREALRTVISNVRNARLAYLLNNEHRKDRQGAQVTEE
jgi:hypothetical protein